MTVNDFTRLFDYSYWANERLFVPTSQLSDEEFTRRVAGSYGSVRDTLVHALSTEWGWLDRCGGLARGARLQSATYPAASGLIAEWRRVESGMREHLARLKDDDLTARIEYPGAEGAQRSMPHGELLHHAALHGMHYRGQVALLLRELGRVPGNVDYLFYVAEKNGLPAW